MVKKKSVFPWIPWWQRRKAKKAAKKRRRSNSSSSSSASIQKRRCGKYSSLPDLLRAMVASKPKQKKTTVPALGVRTLQNEASRSSNSEEFQACILTQYNERTPDNEVLKKPNRISSQPNLHVPGRYTKENVAFEGRTSKQKRESGEIKYISSCSTTSSSENEHEQSLKDKEKYTKYSKPNQRKHKRRKPAYKKSSKNQVEERNVASSLSSSEEELDIKDNKTRKFEVTQTLDTSKPMLLAVKLIEENGNKTGNDSERKLYTRKSSTASDSSETSRRKAEKDKIVKPTQEIKVQGVIKETLPDKNVTQYKERYEYTVPKEITNISTIPDSKDITKNHKSKNTALPHQKNSYIGHDSQSSDSSTHENKNIQISQHAKNLQDTHDFRSSSSSLSSDSDKERSKELKIKSKQNAIKTKIKKGLEKPKVGLTTVSNTVSRKYKSVVEQLENKRNSLNKNNASNTTIENTSGKNATQKCSSDSSSSDEKDGTNRKIESDKVIPSETSELSKKSDTAKTPLEIPNIKWSFLPKEITENKKLFESEIRDAENIPKDQTPQKIQTDISSIETYKSKIKSANKSKKTFTSSESSLSSSESSQKTRNETNSNKKGNQKDLKENKNISSSKSNGSSGDLERKHMKIMQPKKRVAPKPFEAKNKVEEISDASDFSSHKKKDNKDKSLIKNEGIINLGKEENLDNVDYKVIDSGNESKKSISSSDSSLDDELHFSNRKEDINSVPLKEKTEIRDSKGKKHDTLEKNKKANKGKAIIDSIKKSKERLGKVKTKKEQGLKIDYLTSTESSDEEEERATKEGKSKYSENKHKRKRDFLKKLTHKLHESDSSTSKGDNHSSLNDKYLENNKSIGTSISHHEISLKEDVLGHTGEFSKSDKDKIILNEKDTKTDMSSDSTSSIDSDYKVRNKNVIPTKKHPNISNLHFAEDAILSSSESSISSIKIQKLSNIKCDYIGKDSDTRQSVLGRSLDKDGDPNNEYVNKVAKEVRKMSVTSNSSLEEFSGKSLLAVDEKLNKEDIQKYSLSKISSRDNTKSTIQSSSTSSTSIESIHINKENAESTLMTVQKYESPEKSLSTDKKKAPKKTIILKKKENMAIISNDPKKYIATNSGIKTSSSSSSLDEFVFHDSFNSVEKQLKTKKSQLKIQRQKRLSTSGSSDSDSETPHNKDVSHKIQGFVKTAINSGRNTLSKIHFSKNKNVGNNEILPAEEHTEAKMSHHSGAHQEQPVEEYYSVTWTVQPIVSRDVEQRHSSSSSSSSEDDVEETKLKLLNKHIILGQEVISAENSDVKGYINIKTNENMCNTDTINSSQHNVDRIAKHENTDRKGKPSNAEKNSPVLTQQTATPPTPKKRLLTSKQKSEATWYVDSKDSSSDSSNKILTSNNHSLGINSTIDLNLSSKSKLFTVENLALQENVHHKTVDSTTRFRRDGCESSDSESSTSSSSSNVSQTVSCVQDSHSSEFRSLIQVPKNVVSNYGKIASVKHEVPKSPQDTSLTLSAEFPLEHRNSLSVDDAVASVIQMYKVKQHPQENIVVETANNAGYGNKHHTCKLPTTSSVYTYEKNVQVTNVGPNISYLQETVTIKHENDTQKLHQSSSNRKTPKDSDQVPHESSNTKINANPSTIAKKNTHEYNETKNSKKKFHAKKGGLRKYFHKESDAFKRRSSSDEESSSSSSSSSCSSVDKKYEEQEASVYLSDDTVLSPKISRNSM